MLILTPENISYETDFASTDTNDVMYCTLDMSVPKESDFFFQPLVFLESFSAPSVSLKIGDFNVKLPFDINIPWHIMIGDQNVGDFEMLSLEEINNRDFCTPVMNPLTSFSPVYYPIEIVETYNDIGWSIPKLNKNHVLVVPLENTKNPQCAFFINEISGKKLDAIPCSLFYN